MKDRTEVKRVYALLEKGIARGEKRFNHETLSGLKGAYEAIGIWLKGNLTVGAIQAMYPGDAPYERGAYEAVEWIDDIFSDPPIEEGDLA